MDGPQSRLSLILLLLLLIFSTPFSDRFEGGRSMWRSRSSGEIREAMNGPLLISLLPPEKLLDSTGAVPVYEPFIVVLLLIGFLLSLFLRHPGR